MLFPIYMEDSTVLIQYIFKSHVTTVRPYLGPLWVGLYGSGPLGALWVGGPAECCTRAHRHYATGPMASLAPIPLPVPTRNLLILNVYWMSKNIQNSISLKSSSRVHIATRHTNRRITIFEQCFKFHF